MLSWTSQNELVHGLLKHVEACRELDGVIEGSTFETPALSALAVSAIDLYKKHHACATEGQMRDVLEKAGLTGGLLAQCHEALGRVLSADLPSAEWCIVEGRKLAAEMKLRALDIKGLAEQGRFDAVLTAARDAVVLASPRGAISTGPGTLDELAERHKVEVVACPTGLPWLDDLLGGGLHRGRFGTILAEKGGGKSQALVHFGAEALRQGYKVLHASLEMPKWETASRYDRNLSGMTREEILADPATAYGKVKEYEDRLTILENTGKTLSPHGMEAVLDRLEEQPDMVIVDYAQLMSSGKAFSGDMGKRADVETVAIELRRLSQRRKLFLWTAYQANRSGAAKNTNAEMNPIDKTDVAQCYDALWHADVVMSLNQGVHEANLGRGRIFLGDNRGGPSKRIMVFGFDWARSRITEGV